LKTVCRAACLHISASKMELHRKISLFLVET
jgi:hypothetical protein